MLHLFAVLGSLGPHAAELITAAKHALLEATYTPLDEASPAASDDRAIVFVAEWYVKTILLDDSGMDVCFNLDRCDSLSLHWRL